MKQHLVILVAAASVLLLGYVGYIGIFSDAEHRRLEIAGLAGTVTHTDAAGVEHHAALGDAVPADGVVRVGPDGHALLVAGEGTQLVLAAETTVRVLQADARSVMVELDEGRVQARVVAGNRLLGVRAAGRTATAESGAFQVARDADDRVRIAVDEGAVSLDGFGDTTALSAGSRIDVRPGGEPVVSARVVEELLLEMSWPPPGEGKGPAPIGGRTVPYARVAVTGPSGRREVESDAAGHFSVDVQLEVGAHAVTVDVSDGLGEQRRATEVVERKPPPPPVATTEVRFGG